MHTLVNLTGIMFHFGHVQDCQYVNAHNQQARSLMASPNPTINYLTIKLPISLHGEINTCIINSQGQIVKVEKVLFTETYKIDVSNLPPGIYYLLIESFEKSYSKKFIKM